MEYINAGLAAYTSDLHFLPKKQTENRDIMENNRFQTKGDLPPDGLFVNIQFLAGVLLPFGLANAVIKQGSVSAGDGDADH